MDVRPEAPERSPSPGDQRGLSPVVGAALLLVIVIAIGVVTGTALVSLGDELEEPAPLFVQQGELRLEVTNGSLAGQDLVLVHRGGQPLPAEHLELVVDAGTERFTLAPGRTGDLADGAWSVDEELVIPLDTDQVCTGADRLEVSIMYRGESSYVVGQRTVPMAAGGFTVVDGAVVPVSGYTAEARVLGAGFTYGPGGPNIDIRLTVEIGGTVHQPWPENVNNQGNPRSHTFVDQPAGAAISVGATGDQFGTYIAPRTRWSNATDGWVHVLRDGDTPPNLAGFGDQDSAAAYVGPYLDASGNIDLDEHQAIYLFELGNGQTGSSADFQDVVVLVSLQTQQQTVAVTQDVTRGAVIVCPEPP